MPSRWDLVVDEIDRVVAAIEVAPGARGLAAARYFAASSEEQLKGNSGHRGTYHDDPACEDMLESGELGRCRYTWSMVLVLVTDAWNLRTQPRAILDEALAVKVAILTTYVPPPNCEAVLVNGHRTVNVLGTNQVEVEISLVVEVMEDLTP